MSLLDDIAARGNLYMTPPMRGENRIRCADGFTMSVIAGQGAYCQPRPDIDSFYRGPYQSVEVGFPSDKPKPWKRWKQYAEDPSDPTGTVYPFVPVDVVRDLIARHGGEA